MKKIKTVTIILATVAITLVASIGYSTYAAMMLDFTSASTLGRGSSSRENAVVTPIKTINPADWIKNAPPGEKRYSMDARFDAIEARIAALEAKSK